MDPLLFNCGPAFEFPRVTRSVTVTDPVVLSLHSVVSSLFATIPQLDSSTRQELRGDLEFLRIKGGNLKIVAPTLIYACFRACHYQIGVTT